MNTNEQTTGVDAPQFSFADVQRFTALSKGDLQSYGRYIQPAEKAFGTGNRSRYSARNVFSFIVMDQLSRLRIPASVAAEWATTTFVLGDVAYAWFIVPGSDKSKAPHGVEQSYEYGDDHGWGPMGGLDFTQVLDGYMKSGHAFAVIPTQRIFKRVCRDTGTAPE